MLYAEIARKIREEFGDGRFSPGAQMPSENTLVEAFSVSRSTIRKALKSLEEEGFLEQHQGQGTFLRHGRYQRNVSSHSDFISHGKRSGARPSTRLLSTEVREKSIAESSLFDTTPNERVVEIRRLRLMQGEVCVLQTSVLPYTKLADYTPGEFECRSLYKILEADFGVFLGPVKETLTCVNASDQVAGFMGIAPGTAVFVSHRVVRAKDGQVVEISRNFIRSDRYCFVQESPNPEQQE
ncbi:GntR family transcriptional regulator [Oricola sp.]|uniref:GntR family transcriptional regulator n=1 Tax=Oricola sp. TaxID=1979950 RepID=UPI003BABE67F